MTRRMLLSVMALVGVFLAAYLTLYKLGYIGELACKVGQCETVNLSRWSLLFGIPVAVWGLGFYVVLFTVAFAGTTDRFADDPRVSTALLVLTACGVLFSGWLTYLELFVIHAICMYCVISAVLVTLMCGIAVLEWRAARGGAA